MRLEILKLSSREYLYKQHSLVTPPNKTVPFSVINSVLVKTKTRKIIQLKKKKQ